MTFKIGVYRLRSGHIFNKIYIIVTDIVNDVTYSRKSVKLIHAWSSTGKQRRHMINVKMMRMNKIYVMFN